MGDNISRQAAIDALGDKPLAWTEGEYELGLQNQWESDINALQELPSIDAVEVVHGKWILNKAVANIETYYYHCSECGNERCFIGAYKANWCEECGARMDGEQDVLGK